MKLGRNGRLFYRLCTLDKQLTAFSMHIKGAIVECADVFHSEVAVEVSIQPHAAY